MEFRLLDGRRVRREGRLRGFVEEVDAVVQKNHRNILQTSTLAGIRKVNASLNLMKWSYSVQKVI